MRPPAWTLTLLLVGCLGGAGGKPASPDEVCAKMEECDYRYDHEDECREELLEDGKGGEVCGDRSNYMKCIRPCLKDSCSDFEVCEYDCYEARCY
jgi:hypothetical protein